MIQLFLSRGEHDVCFVSFVSSFINQCYKPWPLSQLADTAVYINKLKHLNSIVLSTYWSLNVLDRKKKAVLWLMRQSECLKNMSSADPELFVLTNTCYSSYSLSLKYTSFFSFTAVNWTVFFFTCLKKQEEMLVSVSESLQSEAGSARDETNNQNISYNSPRDGNPIVKVKVKNAIHHTTIMSRT